jgi:hypothetical protein
MVVRDYPDGRSFFNYRGQGPRKMLISFSGSSMKTWQVQQKL